MEVPGPVIAVQLADGAWLGGSRLYSERKITSNSAKLVTDGPVFGEVAIRYIYADGMSMDIGVQLAAGGSQVLFDMNVSPKQGGDTSKLLMGPGFIDGMRQAKEDTPRDGWQLMLSPGLDPLRLVYIPEFGKNRWGEHVYIKGKWIAQPVDVELEKEPEGTVSWLVPWNDWWEGLTKTSLVFKTATRGEVLQVRSREPGDWIQPAPPGIWVERGNPFMRQKWIPVVRGRDGTVFLEMNTTPGSRK